MPSTFNFCPNTLVPETLPPENAGVVSMNGWTFSGKPTVPYQRKFKVTLHGLKWFLNNSTGIYDNTTSPTLNAKALEEFYQAHGTWDPFNWQHPHISGTMLVRFDTPLTVPAAKPNSGGLIDPLELTFIHHDPSYA